MEYQIYQYSNFVVEIETDLYPTPSSNHQHALPVEHIGLIFTYRLRRSRFEVSANGERRLVRQGEGLRVPLCDHQFPSEIFNNRGDDSLFRYLSCSFESFNLEIDAEAVADALIERWIEIREEVNWRSSDRVFPMTVNLTMWQIEARHEIGGTGEGGSGMLPACGEAVEKMLRRFEMEEEDGICVICLDELKKKKKKKKNGEWVLQMPCLHVFHGNCIQEWLNNSHYCPICRFQMPI